MPHMNVPNEATKYFEDCLYKVRDRTRLIHRLMLESDEDTLAEKGRSMLGSA